MNALVSTFIASLRSPCTRASYGAAVDRMLTRLQAHVADPLRAPMADVAPWLQLWAVELARLSLATQRLHIAAANSFYAYLVRMGIRDTNPVQMVPRPRAPDWRDQKAPCHSEADAKKFYAAALETKDPTVRYRDRAMFGMMLSSGLRRAEVGGLRFADLLEGATKVRVMGKGAKRRTVQLEPGTHVALAAYLEASRRQLPQPPTDSVFLGAQGMAIKLSSISWRARDICARAGIAREATHTLRRSYATILASRGATVDQLMGALGHSSPAMSRRYIKNDETTLTLSL